MIIRYDIILQAVQEEDRAFYLHNVIDVSEAFTHKHVDEAAYHSSPNIFDAGIGRHEVEAVEFTRRG